MIKGILVVYDAEIGTYAPLPGADDPDTVQSNPTWSPDGQSIVFARSKVYRKDAIEDATSILLREKDFPEFVEDKEPFKADKCSKGLNDPTSLRYPVSERRSAGLRSPIRVPMAGASGRIQSIRTSLETAVRSRRQTSPVERPAGAVRPLPG